MWRNYFPASGVNVTLDEGLLGPGWKRASNVRLKPGDPLQVHRNRVRNTINAVALGDGVLDLHFGAFEDSTDWLIVVQGSGGATTFYRTYSPTSGAAGSWGRVTDQDGNDAGEATDSMLVHRGNQYFMGTDVGNLTLTGSGVGVSGRHMGMFTKAAADRQITRSHNGGLQNITPPGQGTADTNWSQWDVVLYWWTEYDSSNDLESRPFRFHVVTNAGNANTIFVPVPWQTWDNYTNPTPLNSNADKARLYRTFLGNEGSIETSQLKIDRVIEELLEDKWPLTGGLVKEIDWGSDLGIPTNDWEPWVFEDGDADNGGGYSNVVDGTDDPGTFDPAVKYPLVVTESQGDVALFELLAEPRPFTIGALFNDSVVVNSPTESKQIIRWSPPQQPEYQPEPYFMYFASDRSDEINGIHSVNGVLIVLTNGGVFRVNYLPFDRQIAEATGRVQERITNEHGCVGVEANTTYEDERSEWCVWLSRNGLKATNGAGWRDACPDWSPEGAGWEAGALTDAVLRNNPREYRLELYLNGDEKNERWDFYYHPTHKDRDGSLKCTGPHSVGRQVLGATSGRVSGEDRLYTVDALEILGEGAAVDVETIVLETGHIRADKEVLADIQSTGVGLLVKGDGSASATFTVTARRTNGSDETRTLALTDLERDGAHYVLGPLSGQSISLKVEVSGTTDFGPVLHDVEEKRKGYARGS